jgi:hypothetical protein
MSVDKTNVTEDREDISRFVVHLTRNDRTDFENGSTAAQNFRLILKERAVRPFRPHCLHGKQVPEQHRKKLAVACFSEVPLNQIHLLIREIVGRQIKLEPYGMVFSRRFLIEQGAQPAIYINSYNANLKVRRAVDALFQHCVETDFGSPMVALLPFLNAMHEKYDFTWEREWRMRNTLNFTMKDLICVIVPTDGENKLKEILAQVGLPAISPGWSYEQIASELGRQQRETKRLTGLAVDANGSDKKERAT